MIPVFHLNIKKYNWQEGKGRHKNTETRVPLKYLSSFWRTLEMPLINCEINLILTWSKNYILISGGTDNQAPAFAINDTKLCSSLNFIHPKKCKTIRSIKIRF